MASAKRRDGASDKIRELQAEVRRLREALRWRDAADEARSKLDYILGGLAFDATERLKREVSQAHEQLALLRKPQRDRSSGKFLVVRPSRRRRRRPA